MNTLKMVLALGYIFILVMFLQSPSGYNLFMDNKILFILAALSGFSLIFVAILKLKKY